MRRAAGVDFGGVGSILAVGCGRFLRRGFWRDILEPSGRRRCRLTGRCWQRATRMDLCGL